MLCYVVWNTYVGDGIAARYIFGVGIIMQRHTLTKKPTIHKRDDIVCTSNTVSKLYQYCINTVSKLKVSVLLMMTLLRNLGNHTNSSLTLL